MMHITSQMVNTKMCHNLHFGYTTKEEYENFKNIEDKSCYELKRKINELVKNG